jgi:PleD family two-component response regulator
MNLKALPQENLDTAVNILAILNSREFFSKISPQLFQYGYRIEIVLDMNEAIASIKSKRPDVILLSWNSKNISVVKT